MSTNQLSKQTQIRLSTIKRGLIEGRSYAEIAGECGVTIQTIYRDIHAWIATGDFDDWLREEWLHIHQDIKRKDLKEAYRQLSAMIKRRIAEKIEADVKTVVELKAWNIGEKGEKE